MKFSDCARASRRISDRPAAKAFNAIRTLEQVEDITQVTDPLR